MKILLKIVACLLLVFGSYPGLYSRSWDDLNEGEHKLIGSEREDKYPVQALIIEKEDWENHYSCMFLGFFKYSDYPKYRSLRILPFYYGLDSKIDNRSLTVVPLPLPTWIERDGDYYKKYIFFPIYYSSVDSTANDRSLLWPLFWWGGTHARTQESSYQAFIPLLWFHSSSSDSATGSSNTHWVNPFLYNHNQIVNGEEKSSTIFFPIIPFFFTSSDREEGSHTNILWLIDWARNSDGSMKRWWFAPIAFYENRDWGYRIYLPFYVRPRGCTEQDGLSFSLFHYHGWTESDDTFWSWLYYSNTEKNGSWYYHFIPFFAAWKDTGPETVKQFISPVYNRRKVTDTSTGENIYSNLFFPIIPLFYRSYDRQDGTHGNIAWLIDYEKNSDGTWRTFWFAPIAFYEFRDAGYRIFPPFFIRPADCTEQDGWSLSMFHYHGWTESDDTFWSWLYYSNTEKNGSWYYHFIPIFAAWKDTGTETEKQIISPLFARRSVTDSSTGGNIYSNFFFPIIPLFYTSNDREEGTHRNILWIFDWASNKEGSLNRWWIIPLFYHETRDWGYRIYLPFYVRTADCNEQDGLSFSLFHYHRWSPGRDKFWAWLYYHNEGYTTQVAGKNQPDIEEEPSEYYRHLLPLYWSWKNTESNGSLILPVYMNYNDEDTNLHVNLTGIAYKTFTGPYEPYLMLDLEKKENNWYLDTDISWFYDLFSVAWRTSVPGMKEKNMIKEGFTGPGERPVSIKKRSTEREDSINYFGWDVLFGWMAYRHADTRKHWRILPLAWFTYDERSEDKLQMFLPFYVDYYSDELKEGYFLAAPFYASQRDGDSYKHGYLVNLFWSEYDAENDYREKTVLWPFINWYDSPDRGGFRFFPLFWYKNWKEGEDRMTRTFSPVHYTMSIQDAEARYTYRKRLSIFYYLKESVTESDSSYTLFAPLLPLYYYSEDTVKSAEGIAVKETLSVSPFHIHTERSSGNDYESVDSSKWMIPVVPLFYWNMHGSYSHWNLLGFTDRSTDAGYSRFFILPVLYTTNQDNVKHRNILGFIDWSTNPDDSMKRLWIAPIVFYEYRDWGYRLYLPFYARPRGCTEQDGLSFSLFHYHGWTESDDTFWSWLYYSNTEKNGSWYYHFIPLFAAWKDTGTETEEQIISPLFARRSVTDSSTGGNIYSNFFFPIIPLFYTSNDREEGTHRNILWIFDWASNKEGSLNRWWFIPLFYHETRDWGYRIYLPFYVRTADCNEQDGLSFSLFHYHAWTESDDTFWSWLYYSNTEKNGSWYYHFIPLFAAWKDTGTETVKQFLSPVYNRRKITDSATGEEIYSNILLPIIPLFYRSHDREEGTHTNIAWLVDWERDKGGHMRTLWIAPIVFYEYRDAGYRIFPPFFIRPADCTEEDGWSLSMFHYHGWTETDDTFWAWLYYSNTEKNGSWYYHFIPLYAKWHDTGSGTETVNQFISPAYSSRRVTDSATGEEMYSNFFFPIIPLYYQSNDNIAKVRHTNLLGIIDWKNGDYWKSKFIAGLYLYSSAGYERENFLYLYDHKMYRYGSMEYNEYNFLLTLAGADISPEVLEIRMAWGALFEYSKSRTSDSYSFDALLWLAGINNEGGGFHHRLIPLWYYRSDSNSNSLLVIPPVLSWFSKKDSDRFDLVLLGALYYRNQNHEAGEDRMDILAGILYDDVTKPERGFHTRGSMWGYLWDYETEDETGFSKFSILKGLFKHVHNNGNEKNTFLWLL